MAVGRRFEKPLNRHTLATIPSIFTKSGTMTYFGRLCPVHRNNYEFLTFQDGGRQ